jgi:P-type E1-E2 ATPase
VIDGETLKFALRDVDALQPDYLRGIAEFGVNATYISDTRDIFLDSARNCRTVICCRADPIQKATVVKSIRSRFNTVTMSVGDGANDVPMIMEANIGVGIYGEEGMQAVQASDVSLGEFQYLERLILRHGRLNYLRQCEMIHYFFYKNLVFTIP